MDKLPPHDVDAEEAVLGSILIDEEALTRVATLLRPPDFYREHNRWVYEAAVALLERDEAVNPVTVGHELARLSRLDPAGGIGYLSQLAANVPTSIHAEYYAAIVQRTATMRRLIQAAGQITALAYEDPPDAETALSRAEELLLGVREGRSARDLVHIRDLLEEYFETGGFSPRIREGELPFIQTGFIELDRLLGGLQRSDLVVLAARPSMGKSAFALSIAANAGVRQNARVAIFSLEMSAEQNVQRLLSAEAGVDSQRLRLGGLNETEERRLMEAMGILAGSDLYIDDSPILNIVEIRTKLRRLHAERPLDLVVVDYLQLVQGSHSSGQNRVQEISEISRLLKAIARELDAPVLALSQLSRAVESRSPKIPLLSDLRDSGSIEQDADVVTFIYRDDVYYTEKEWERHNPTRPYPKGIADIIISKHRHGPTGQVSLLFFEKTTRFANLELHRQ
jgi:replicative DNA helicase